MLGADDDQLPRRRLNHLDRASLVVGELTSLRGSRLSHVVVVVIRDLNEPQQHVGRTEARRFTSPWFFAAPG